MAEIRCVCTVGALSGQMGGPILKALPGHWVMRAGGQQRRNAVAVLYALGAGRLRYQLPGRLQGSSNPARVAGAGKSARMTHYTCREWAEWGCQPKALPGHWLMQSRGPVAGTLRPHCRCSEQAD